MPFRFRKSKSIGGVRVTVGKRGLSTSVGGKGQRVSVGRKGVTQTVGIPGTGLSYSRRGCRQSVRLLVLAPAGVALAAWLVSRVA